MVVVTGLCGVESSESVDVLLGFSWSLHGGVAIAFSPSLLGVRKASSSLDIARMHWPRKWEVPVLSVPRG